MDIQYTKHNGSTLITVSNNSGLTLCLSEIGAGIVYVKLHDVMLSYQPQDLDVYLSSGNGGYYGKTIGPLAGRIKHGQYTIENKTYQLQCNEGPHCLHSANLGLDLVHFKAECCVKEDCLSVLFSQKIGPSEGYPFTLHVLIRYLVDLEENSFTCSMKAQSDCDAPINLTNHVYWNLGEEEDLLSDLLTVKASKVATYDADMIPLGEEEVDQALDFRKAKPLGQDILDPKIYKARFHGYDHGFILDQVKEGRPNCVLENKKYRLKFFTDAPAVQIYSNNYPKNGLAMGSGEADRFHAAITLEPISLPLDPSKMVVKAGEKFRRNFKYSFEELEDEQ